MTDLVDQIARVVDPDAFASSPSPERHNTLTLAYGKAYEIIGVLAGGYPATIPCRFAETGCKSEAAEIVYVPEGCICWRDPVQALCEQHLLTLETVGPATTLLSLRNRHEPDA